MKQAVWIFGALQRTPPGIGQPCVLIVEPDRARRTLLPLILRHVIQGSQILQDLWAAYQVLPNLGYVHDKDTVNHNVRFVDPYDPTNHINDMEGINSLLKISF